MFLKRVILACVGLTLFGCGESIFQGQVAPPVAELGQELPPSGDTELGAETSDSDMLGANRIALIGDDKDNRLITTQSAENITGKAGRDVFVFNSVTGGDVITDFSMVDDVLAFGDDPYKSLAELKAMLQQFDGYVILDLGEEGQVRIENVWVDDFDYRNFRIAENHPDGPGPFRQSRRDTGIQKSIETLVVSEVKGNTSTFNGIAELSVRLRQRPSATVTVPLRSTKEWQGQVEPSELIFTPETWNTDQTIIVRGMNANTQNNPQNYQIEIGPTRSEDPLFAGQRPFAVKMRGIVLEVDEPDISAKFLSNSEAEFRPEIIYTGNAQLSYSLENAPDGMTIDLSTGVIQWVPAPSDEGQTFVITVLVNDGERFASTEFDVSVSAPAPIATMTSGNEFTVEDETTSLNGLAIRTVEEAAADSSDISSLSLRKLDTVAVPALPNTFTALTDVFVVDGVFDNEVEIRFPLGTLPEGVELRDIKLYNYGRVPEIDQPFWAAVSTRTRFEGSPASPIIVFRLGRLENMAVIGYERNLAGGDDNTGSQIIKKNEFPTELATESISCVQEFAFPPDEGPLDSFICTTTTDPDIQITIADFGVNTQTRWGGISKEMIVDYLLTAQTWFSAAGLGFEKEFKVKVSTPPREGVFGFVRRSENYNTLHLSNDNQIAKASMQGTIVHEYFHHAQGNSGTQLDGQVLALRTLGRAGTWMTEGTARWVEDEIYDSLNTYGAKEGNRGSRIAEAGINSYHGNGVNRPYQRFSFFKWLNRACGGSFSTPAGMQALLNVDASGDSTGIESLTDLFSGLSCNFGNHFGSDRASSLEAAIAYYNYATQFKNTMSRLDANEPNSPFKFSAPSYEFNRGWLGRIQDWLGLSEESVYTLNDVTGIPPVGAYSFKLLPIQGELPDGKVAELSVDSDREIFVSLASTDSAFTGTNQIGTDAHDWYSTRDGGAYVFPAGSHVPEVFVTLVNADLERRATVNVTFTVRDEVTAETIITSHQTGDQVSDRVLSIAGMIPEEARQDGSEVVIKNNGIATRTPLLSNGSFSGEIVASLGDNIVSAQAFNNGVPITVEEVITIQGVESSSTRRNALIASRAVFVLRWNTNSTDLDIYTTDKNNNTIWYSNTRVGPGNLDFDDTSGFGPEVISYRDGEDALYSNGRFDVDVHYYSGSLTTDYTLDVILNETEGSNRRSLRFASITPLLRGNSSEDDPDGTGASRHNDILKIACSAQRVCALSGFDASRLRQADNESGASAVSSQTKRPGDMSAETIISAYAQGDCENELSKARSKSKEPGWRCQADGTKLFAR